MQGKDRASASQTGSAWNSSDLQDHSKRLTRSVLSSYQYYSLFIIHEQLKAHRDCISQQPDSSSNQYRQLKATSTGNKHRVLLAPVYFPQLTVRGNAHISKASYCIWIKELKQLLMDIFFTVDIQLNFCPLHPPTLQHPGNDSDSSVVHYMTKNFLLLESAAQVLLWMSFPYCQSQFTLYHLRYCRTLLFLPSPK